VPEDLQKAAKVDGATGWQRFTKDHAAADEAGDPGRPAVRTLDSFRIFDNIYILTLGANGTGVSVSILGYDNLFNALNLWHRVDNLDPDLHLRRDHRLPIHQGLRHRGPPARTSKEVTADGCHPLPATRTGWADGELRRHRAGADPGALAGSRCPSRRPRPCSDPSFIPSQWTWGNYTGDPDLVAVHPAAGQLDRIGLISTLIAVVLASMRGLRGRAAPVPRQERAHRDALLIAMFPLIALVTRCSPSSARWDCSNTWPGLIIPYGRVRAAAGHLHPVGGSSVRSPGAGEGGQVRRRHALPGSSSGSSPARRAGNGHHWRI